MARVRTGSIHRLKSGKWFARYTGPDGGRHGKAFLTKRDATAWLQQIYSDISSGKFAPSDALVVITFGDYANRWLVDRKVKGQPLAERTLSNYHDVLNRFILSEFGNKPIHVITRDEVEKWYDRTALHSPTYRARAYSLLKSIMASAVDDGYLLANPARIRGGGQVKRLHKVRPATLLDLQVITEAMPQRYRLMVQLAAWCALRFGELTELRRGDVDTKTGILKIRRAVVCVDGRFVVKEPKSEAGVRDVNIPPHLLPMVREHLLTHTALGSDGLLFPSKNDPDDHLRQSALVRVYYPAREAAGRPDLRFHDLRHTGAVLAAQTGATLAELMGRLGHSTPAMAMRYQHVAEDRDAVIAAKLSEMTGWAAGPTTPPRGG